eukprot:SAG31_NODE_8040_length_1535_cov_19.130919_1_plen_291_part_00
MHTICLLIDELSMFGKIFMGQMAKACSHVFGSGVVSEADGIPLWGGLNIVLCFGDFCQLGPIADAVLYGDGATAQNKVAQYGESAFATLTSTYVLTEPVRQDKASEFYKQLHAVRSGQIDDAAATFWNGRQKLHLPSAQKALFDHVQTDGLLVLTCTRLERSAVNLDYVRGLRKVCRVNAVVSGKHAQKDKDRDVGMCKSIPTHIVYAIGMKVKLTVNICDRWGLCNGSRGTIVDIIYPNEYVIRTSVGFSTAEVAPVPVQQQPRCRLFGVVATIRLSLMASAIMFGCER